MSKTPLFDAARELRQALDRLMVSSSNNADSALRRFVSLLEPGTVLGDLSAEILPTVDFATWYAVACATMGASVGSGELDFPLETRERVAMELALLRHVASDPQGIRGFGLMFFRGNWDERARAFGLEVAAPFFNEWLALVTPAIEAEGTEPRPTKRQRHQTTRCAWALVPTSIPTASKSCEHCSRAQRRPLTM